MAYGVFIPGLPWDEKQLDAWLRRLGAKPASLTWYQSWDRPYDPLPFESLLRRNIVPVLTWEPWKPATPRDQTYSLAKIAGGTHDGYVRSWAEQLGRLAGTVHVRFAHEANGDWYPWGNDATTFCKAFKRVADLMPSNVRMVWSPNVIWDDRDLRWWQPERYHRLAIDGYPWLNESPSALFGPTLSEIAKFNKKPVVIGETACDESVDKPRWIDELFALGLETTWFSEKKERDWRIDSSQRSLLAFRRAVRR